MFINYSVRTHVEISSDIPEALPGNQQIPEIFYFSST